MDSSSAAVVRTVAATGFACSVEAEGHRWGADEPEALGGTGTGATPMAQALGALGACTAITLRMYAARKGWALEGVEVRLAHTRATDGGAGPADRIARTVRLTGPLDAEQRRRLMEIADKCPVHRLMSAGAAITTTEGS